jgi:hypothetical protein
VLGTNVSRHTRFLHKFLVSSFPTVSISRDAVITGSTVDEGWRGGTGADVAHRHIASVTEV